MSTQIEKFKQIADKIREKTGTEDTMTANDFVDKIDDVYSAGQSSMVDGSKIISKTASGVGSLHLNNVSEIPHKIGCTIESLNLLKRKTVSTEANGISVTYNDDGSITINGIATAKTRVEFNVQVESGEDYIVSATYLDESGNVINRPTGVFLECTVKNTTGTLWAKDYNASSTFSPDVSATMQAFIFIEPDTTVENVTVKPMLNRGSEALPYVPYVAPESVELTVCGKNLCKYPYIDGEEKETNGVTFTVNADMSITAKGTATAQAYFKLLLLPYLSGLTFKEDYVISDCSINVNSLTAYVNVSEGETVDKTFYPQIEYGSTPTDYAPYSATPYTVNAEGTVNIVSTHETSPIMNIIASNPNVNITVNYNKSYGMQTEHDRLWDTLQKNGGPANYHYKFAYSSFTDDTYNPIYPLRFTSSTNAAQSVFYATDITDTKVPIHAEGCNISGMFYRYGSAQPLKTIRELHVDEKTIININTFTRTDNLENITFVGSIACDLIINWSKKLTKASITSIINALSDSENISGKEVRLSKTAVNNAFGIDVDNETTYPEGSEYYILRHSRDNWNFSYIDEG